MKRKLGVVVSGWHFPLKFYEQVVQQKVPDGWEVDYFCVSHRDPSFAVDEKAKIISQLGDSTLCKLDKILYDKIPNVKELKDLGWVYDLESNSCGDWVVTNQWIDRYPNYMDYEILLLTHDDNFLIGDELFLDVLENRFDTLVRNDYSVNHMPEFLDKNYGPNDSSLVPLDNWNVLSNAVVNGTGGLRGSFDFFKTSLIEKMGGGFSLEGVELDRTNETDNMDMEYYGSNAPTGGLSMKDWEKPINKFFGFMYDHELINTIRYLSPVYRVSNYCIEGERGLLSNMATPQSVYYNNTVGQLDLNGIL